MGFLKTVTFGRIDRIDPAKSLAKERKLAVASNGGGKAGFVQPQGGGGGMFGSEAWLGRVLSGDRIDWEKDAGRLHKNSAVGACLWYICDTFPEAPFCVYRTDSKNQRTIVGNHPLTALLRRPRGTAVGGAAIPGSLLWMATVLSITVDGNAFWILRRNAANRIVGIEYVPHWTMTAISGGDYVSRYDYRPGNGQTYPYDPADVIHFRQGIDPENTKMGLARLKTVTREIVADNEATIYTAAILKNAGVPAAIATPKVGTDGEVPAMKTGFRERMKELWREITGGNNRGDLLVIDHAVDLQFPGFTPEQLVLDKIRAIPETRICGATRVPAIIAQLLVGEQHKTYANMGEARHMAYESVIMPLQELIADTIDAQLLPQMPMQDGDQCGFDRTLVQVLQQDMDKLWARVTKAFDAGLITRYTGKMLLNVEADETEDDVYITDLAPAVEPMPGDGGQEDDPIGDAEKTDSGGDSDKAGKSRARLSLEAKQNRQVEQLKQKLFSNARARRAKYDQGGAAPEIEA